MNTIPKNKQFRVLNPAADSHRWLNSTNVLKQLNYTCVPPSFLRRWSHLEKDIYLKNGENFRFRRYCLYNFDPDSELIIEKDETSFYQSIETNSYVGGIERVYPKIKYSELEKNFIYELIKFNSSILPSKNGFGWLVGIHQIRITVKSQQVINPAPEGIHTDGHDYVIIHLMNRENVTGGECTIYDAENKKLDLKTLRNTLDTAIINDKYYKHGISSITQKEHNCTGYRDVLIMDYNYSKKITKKSS